MTWINGYKYRIVPAGTRWYEAEFRTRFGFWVTLNLYPESEEKCEGHIKDHMKAVVSDMEYKERRRQHENKPKRYVPPVFEDMKKKRLLKLAQRLLTLAGEETKFNMMELYDGCHPEDYDGNECGAVACIAGHAVLMKEGKDFDPKGEWIDFLGEAQDYLGLTLREREQLFLSCVPTHHLEEDLAAGSRVHDHSPCTYGRS